MPNDRHSELCRSTRLTALDWSKGSLLSSLCARAFTLVEMLTVIAIIGILAGILIPVVRIAMMKARIATASADVSHLYQAATAYNLDFGAFPPDCTAFWSPQDNPFPGAWNKQPAPYNTPLCPNELLMWYLTMQYSTGNLAAGYPAGYPANWAVPPASDAAGDWTPSSASVVFSRVPCGPYFDMKAKQKTDRNGNGFYEFMDPWGRPYMYRAYPQWASVNTAGAPVQQPNNGPWTVTLTLNNITGYNGYTFYMNTNLTNTVGSIQLSGFSNANYNGTFTFTGASSNTVNLTFPSTTSPGPAGTLGTYTFPLHNPQTCDIYSLGPYGLTRAANMPLTTLPLPSGSIVTQEWKPTHGGGTLPDSTSLDDWPDVWGTPGDGNDITSTSGNTIVNVLYQDNICNWN